MLENCFADGQIFRGIGAVLHAIVNGIATVLMAIVNGIATFFNALISCITYRTPLAYPFSFPVLMIVADPVAEEGELGELGVVEWGRRISVRTRGGGVEGL